MSNHPVRAVIQPYLEQINDHVNESGDVLNDAHNLGDTEFSEKLRQVHNRLNRARKEFDATLFVIVCFGMLKSGKSTLINLLAKNKNASPTGFGRDTTRRPCLIMNGDRSAIHQYYPSLTGIDTDTEKNQHKDAFDTVFSYLRGSITLEELRNHRRPPISIREVELTVDNLSQALCEPNPGAPIEPFITVVTIPDSPLLKNGIALLDVPGLDSAISDWPKQGWYNWLLNRCDFLIFIQSTVSALNLGGENVLRDLMEKSKQPPVWLVQNTMEMRPWLSAEKRRAESNMQADDSRNRVCAALGRQQLAQKISNLGKAFAGRFLDDVDEGKARELLNESDFESLENDLLQTLNDNRVGIQLNNSAGSLDDCLTEERTILTTMISDLHIREIEARNEENQCNQALLSINHLNYSSAQAHIKTDIQPIIHEKQSDWRIAIEASEASFTTDMNRTLTGKAINEHIAQHTKKCCVDCQSQFFSTERSAAFGSFIHNVICTKLNEIEREALDALNLPTHIRSAIFLDNNWNLGSLTIPNASPPDAVNYQLKEKKAFFFERKYNADDTFTTRNALKTNIEGFVTSYSKELEHFLFNTALPNYINQRREHLRTEICACRDRARENADQIIAKIILQITMIEKELRIFDDLSNKTSTIKNALHY